MADRGAGRLPGAPKLRTVSLVGALLIVYLFWGATYLGIRYAVQTIPPFFMAGTRFLLAGGLVYLYARLRGAARPRGRHWLTTGAVGALLLVGGNGLVSWAEQRVSSGIAALLIATVPLWMILIGLLGKEVKRPSAVVLAGLTLGFAGIGVLVLPAHGGTERLSLLGTSALLIASLSWALGSLHSRKADLPASPLLSNGMQMMTGGLLLMAVSGLLGEWSELDVLGVSRVSLLGLGYLVLFGSIVAYNAYLWLLKNADPILVSTYAFVNPLVAVLIGWLVAGERLQANAILAAILIIGAVMLITLDQKLAAKARKRNPRS